MPLGTVDRVELIGSFQFNLPVARAIEGLMPGEVMFQPHHIGDDGVVSRRLIRLASEGRIILSGPISTSEAEVAARHQFNVGRYQRNVLAAAERLPGAGTTSSSGSADEFARMVGSSNRGLLPLGFQGNVIFHWRSVANCRLGSYSCESSLADGQNSVSVVDLTELCLLLVGQMSPRGEEFRGRVDGCIVPSAAEREDNFRAAARDALSPGSVGFSSPSSPGFVRCHRSGRTFGGGVAGTVSSPSIQDVADPVMPVGGLYVDDGAALSPGSVALASRFARVPYDPSMVRPCRREFSYVEGGRRCSCAISPAADYDMSVLDIVIAGSLRGLHVVEVVEEDRDHCVVRVFRSPPREEGMIVCIISRM